MTCISYAYVDMIKYIYHIRGNRTCLRIITKKAKERSRSEKNKLHENINKELDSRYTPIINCFYSRPTVQDSIKHEKEKRVCFVVCGVIVLLLMLHLNLVL